MKMTRILFVGDVHIRTDNFPEVDKLEVIIKNLVEKEDIDQIVFAGDILHHHERLHTLSLNKAIGLITNCSKLTKVYVLVGNHDMINNQQFLSNNHWMNCLKNIRNVVIVDSPVFEESSKIFYVPYVFPGRFMELFEYSKIDPDDCNLIFAHQEFKGCKMGAIVSDIGDVWDEDKPLVISGHIHDYQKPQKNIFYPGTPMQQSFGDNDENIVLIIDTSGKEVEFKEVPTNLSNKKIIHVTVDNLKKLKMDKIENDEKQIKIVVNGTMEEIQSFKKTKKFKELEGVCKVVLKVDLPEKGETSQKYTKKGEFNEILHEMIMSTGNSRVISDYKKIFG
jgi:DNA repair exonuclease SbcCD nuclease subunit